ncbi:MAG TPA: hypothetical protein VG347_18605 [Verrucomicrobiae bacterium]|nr:hypothetical protein [Verrucomicrobiae bacterium]
MDITEKYTFTLTRWERETPLDNCLKLVLDEAEVSRGFAGMDVGTFTNISPTLTTGGRAARAPFFMPAGGR